jgi:hypothetical protein
MTGVYPRRLKQLEFGMPLETDTEPEPVLDEEAGAE